MSTIDVVFGVIVTLAIVILLAYVVAMLDIHFMYKRINKQHEQEQLLDKLKRRY